MIWGRQKNVLVLRHLACCSFPGARLLTTWVEGRGNGTLVLLLPVISTRGRLELMYQVLPEWGFSSPLPFLGREQCQTTKTKPLLPFFSVTAPRTLPLMRAVQGGLPAVWAWAHIFTFFQVSPIPHEWKPHEDELRHWVLFSTVPQHSAQSLKCPMHLKYSCWMNKWTL